MKQRIDRLLWNKHCFHEENMAESSSDMESLTQDMKNTKLYAIESSDEELDLDDGESLWDLPDDALPVETGQGDVTEDHGNHGDDCEDAGLNCDEVDGKLQENLHLPSLSVCNKVMKRLKNLPAGRFNWITGVTEITHLILINLKKEFKDFTWNVLNSGSYYDRSKVSECIYINDQKSD